MIDFDFSKVPPGALRGPDAVALSTPDGLRHGYLCGRYVVGAGLTGPIVECGVAAGAQAAMMARGVMDAGGHNALHLYDSFEGIPLAGPKDAEQPGIGKITHDANAPLCERLKSSGVSAFGMDIVRRNHAAWGVKLSTTYVKGWFQDTVPLCDLTDIAILRLDGDLYESTMVCLQHLYDRVAVGGLIIIDDIDLPGCRLACDEFCASRGLPYAIQMVEVGGGYHIGTWVKA